MYYINCIKKLRKHILVANLFLITQKFILLMDFYKYMTLKLPLTLLLAFPVCLQLGSGPRTSHNVSPELVS